MKTAIAALAVAVLLSGPAYATTEHVLAKDPVARAQAKAALRSVRALNVRVQDLEIANNCLKNVVGVSQYSGYVWTDGTFNYTTTALDVTPSGYTPGAYVQLVDAGCLGSFRAMRLAPSRKP